MHMYILNFEDLTEAPYRIDNIVEEISPVQNNKSSKQCIERVSVVSFLLVCFYFFLPFVCKDIFANAG